MLFSKNNMSAKSIKVSNFIKLNEIKQTEDINDEEDKKDYEFLAKSIRDNNKVNVYKKRTKRVINQVLSRNGKNVLSSCRSQKALTEFNEEFVRKFIKAIEVNKNSLSNYKQCIDTIDNGIPLKQEEEKIEVEQPKQIHQLVYNSSFGKGDISSAETNINPISNNSIVQTDKNINVSKPVIEQTAIKENEHPSTGLTKEEVLLLQNKAKMYEKKHKRKRVLQNSIRYLMSNGIKVSEYCNSNPFKAKPYSSLNSEEFINAVKFNHIHIIKEVLMYNKSYLYEYDYLKQTAIHWAAKLGLKDMLQVLITNTKSVNQYDYKMRTPLYLAALFDHEDCVRLLIQNGGNPLLGDIDGNKPVDVAASDGIRKEIIKAIDTLYGDSSKKEML